MRSPVSALGAALVLTACAGGASGPGPAPAPSPSATPAAPAAATVMQQAAQAEPPKARAIDPSGMYYVSLTYGGMPLSVTLQITKANGGGYTGAISVDQVPQPIPLNTVEVNGKRVVATLTSPDGGVVTMDFTVDGLDLSGTYKSTSGDGSPLSGKKQP